MELGPAAGKLDVLAVVSTAGGGVSHHRGALLPSGKEWKSSAVAFSPASSPMKVN
jgi:hypothetical protein